MGFGRRDAVLVAGLLLVMVGLLPFMSPAYAAIVVILVYVGVRVYTGRRRAGGAVHE